MINGPNISTPLYLEGGESVTLCLGSCAIFCVPNLPLRHLQITHLLMTLLVTLFLHIIQKTELFNGLSVTTLFKWPTLMWHNCRNFLEIVASFGSTIGWRRFSLYADSDNSFFSNKWIRSVKRALFDIFYCFSSFWLLFHMISVEPFWW